MNVNIIVFGGNCMTNVTPGVFDISVLVLYCTLIHVAFLIGLFKVCLKPSPLYLKMLVFAVGGYSFEAIGELVSTLCNGYGTTIRISFLGLFVYYMFIAAANAGETDKLFDGGSRKGRKAHLIALIAPFVFTVESIFALIYLWEDMGKMAGISLIIDLVPKIVGSYFCAKHLLMPDNSDATLKMIRRTDAFIMISFVFEDLYTYSYFISTVVVNIATIFLILSIGGIVFVSVKEAKSWKISA